MSDVKGRVPAGIKCRFDGPQGWYDWLVKTSAEGGFPASSPSTPEELAAKPRVATRCRYLTPDGKQCGVGGLFTPEDAGRLEAAMGGSSPVESYDVGWQNCLPPWLTAYWARQVQYAHDDQVNNKSPWNHRYFVVQLNGLQVFRACTKVEVPA